MLVSVVSMRTSLAAPARENVLPIPGGHNNCSRGILTFVDSFSCPLLLAPFLLSARSDCVSIFRTSIRNRILRLPGLSIFFRKLLRTADWKTWIAIDDIWVTKWTGQQI